LSGLSINLKKSQLLGVGIPDSQVLEAATLMGCSVLHMPFKYLGIMVGENMSSIMAWDETVNKLKVGNGMSTSFWHDQWLGDSCLRLSYPHLFALENNKVCTVAAKMSAPFVSSLRRDVRSGEESAQLSWIFDLLDTVVHSNMGDRRMLDDMLLPKFDILSRWVKQIPIKVNVLAWKISINRLPTRVNLHRRGVQ
nr:hypothetical protein [Tanacetum cinerariifolium]